MTEKQQKLMDAMENYVQCMRASGKMYEMWNNFSPEVKLVCFFLFPKLNPIIKKRIFTIVGGL